MMLIGSSFKVQDERIVGVESKYPIPVLKSKDEANEHYEDIMSIILTHQANCLILCGDHSSKDDTKTATSH